MQMLKNRLRVDRLKVIEYKRAGFTVPQTATSAIPPQQGKVLDVGRDVSVAAVGDEILFALQGMQDLGDGTVLVDEDRVIGVKSGR